MSLALPGAGSFRALLALALLLITWLATSEMDGPVLIEVNDKLQHLAAFYGLGLLADFSFRHTGFGPAKFLPLLAYGLALETIQYFIPFREFSLLDLAADAAGLALYATSVPLLRRRRPLAQRWAHQ